MSEELPSENPTSPPVETQSKKLTELLMSHQADPQVHLQPKPVSPQQQVEKPKTVKALILLGLASALIAIMGGSLLFVLFKPKPTLVISTYDDCAAQPTSQIIAGPPNVCQFQDKSFKAEVVMPSPLVTDLVAVENQPIDTTDWLTYTDAALGMRLKYPPTWQLVSQVEPKPEYSEAQIVRILPPEITHSEYCQPEFDCYPLARLSLKTTNNLPSIDDLARSGSKFEQGQAENTQFTSVFNSQQAPYPSQTYFALPDDSTAVVEAWLPSVANCRGECPVYQDSAEIISVGAEIEKILTTVELIPQADN